MGTHVLDQNFRVFKCFSSGRYIKTCATVKSPVSTSLMLNLLDDKVIKIQLDQASSNFLSISRERKLQLIQMPSIHIKSRYVEWIPIMGGKAKWEAEGKRRRRRSSRSTSWRRRRRERRGQEQMEAGQKQRERGGEEGGEGKWKLPSASLSIIAVNIFPDIFRCWPVTAHPPVMWWWTLVTLTHSRSSRISKTFAIWFQCGQLLVSFWGRV